MAGRLYKVAVMIRSAAIALTACLLLVPAASGQSEELNAAIDAYLAEDYSHVDVIAGYAEDGVPKAVALLGQAYLYGYGVEADQALGVALLEQAAALGERSSTVHLGRVFEFGLQGVPPAPETAAKWYIMAARAGDTRSAPAALKRLPRDIVIAAGGTAWAREPGSRTAAVEEDQTGSSVAPPAISPASALLGTSNAPTALTMNDGTSFPLLANTRLSRVGDAAASCQAVIQPEIERQKTALEDLMKLDGFGALQSSGSRHAELAETDRRIAALQETLSASEALLADPERNGGLTGEDLETAKLAHRAALGNRPGSGPAASLCSSRLVSLIGQSAAWPAGESGR